MLYIVSTPIGNLQDISLRAIQTLKECSTIYCEDTRLSIRLLKAHGIDTPLKSYHKFNEKQRLSELIERLKGGEDLALISDAGTPLIADPGSILIKALYEEKLPITTIPGPSAPICALVLSGLSDTPFQFIGFFEKKKMGLIEQISNLTLYQGSTIAFISPHKLIDTFKAFEKVLPNHPLFIAREITKKFEEYLWATPQELLDKWSKQAVKGEFVMVIPEVTSSIAHNPQEWIEHLKEVFSLSTKEALGVAAKHLNLSKRSLYNQQLKDR
ncbi:16S rRNA (cytidine(1402)-2'-O)-methyltransferase [Candidatus Aerophobetes bacterium]|uniref:Ribosomal RNA small subunit methyltransferase I n=1 Tax=Aerophobetes bacterium TaxID=2030807 RepID=A0A2A4X3U0_UNCAE|nr:MAG: 16S rRNA (cytidine(1402)-2'-O)-methyltransferase [Candidatus Aerophobetes bacterium]